MNKKLDDIKQRAVKVRIAGKDEYLFFNLVSYAYLEGKYGSLDKALRSMRGEDGGGIRMISALADFIVAGLVGADDKAIDLFAGDESVGLELFREHCATLRKKYTTIIDLSEIAGIVAPIIDLINRTLIPSNVITNTETIEKKDVKKK